MKHHRTKFRKHQTDSEILFTFLKKNIATAAMAEQETGIRICSICQHKRNLEEAGRLWKLFRGVCKRTGARAWFLTTDPILMKTIKTGK